MKEPTQKSVKMRIFNATQDGEFRDKCEMYVKHGRLHVIVPCYTGQIMSFSVPLKTGWEDEFKSKVKKFHLKYQQTIAH